MRPNRSSLAASAAWIAVPPILVAIVLSLPCLGLGYFWDDYVFLTRVQSSPIAALGPEPGAFYRPLPRGLYFWPLASLGSSGALIAHLFNMILLAASVYLLVSLTRSLAGPEAGMFAGLFFAALAPAPSLVAWASGSQDLLAIVFSLAALHLRNSGKNLWAGTATAAGLLSKETVAVMVPVLVLWDWIVGRKPARVWTSALGYGGLGLAWLLLHPGIRELASRGFGSEPRGYVGFANLAVSEFHARRYLLALFNVPNTPAGAHWLQDRIVLGIVAIVIAIAGAWLAARRGAPEDRPARLSIRRAAVLAILIAGPGLILPSLLVHRWAAYFICLPAIGSSLLLGLLLSHVPLALATTAIAAYVGLGSWCRAVEVPGADALTERNFVEANRAIREVEGGFRKLHPTFPRESQVLVSVASSGMLGIHGTILDGQALRIWYRDATIRTLRPERRGARPRAEFLVRVTAALDVVEIDPDRGTSRGSGGSPDMEEVHAIIRTYARGLAASGETDRAVRILERLSAHDEESLRSYDLRLAAMALLANRDHDGAQRLLSKAPPISRESALYGVAKVMSEPTGRADLDSCAFPAFGLSPSDPETLRYFMEMYYASQFVPQAIHFARWLQEIAPADSESAEILRELGAARRRPGSG